MTVVDAASAVRVWTCDRGPGLAAIKMLPTTHHHHRGDGKGDKWGMNNVSRVLALALLLLLSLQLLTWNGRSFVQLPCPFLVHSPPLSIPVPSDPLSSDQDVVLTPNLTQVDAELKEREEKLKHAEDELRQKKVELKQKEVELKQEETLKVMEEGLNVAKGELRSDRLPPPNSYFLEADSDVWACRQHYVDERNLTYRNWVTGGFTDQQALCAAHRHAKRPMAAGTPRIAFLFLTRGPIPTEPIWRRFFAGQEDRYSIYVHAANRAHEYPLESLFRNRTIPSQPIDKMKISFSEAMRRLLTYALLDSTTPNSWFHIVCDSSVPVRSFPFVYDYVMGSDRSFVEAFYPTSRWWRENWSARGEMAIPDALMRKGEAWATLHRRHAGLVVGDHYVFPRFKHHWYEWGFSSELYIPTLLTVADPLSVANHSLVYVDWIHSPPNTSSPVSFNRSSVSPELIRGIQRLTSNEHGFYQFDKAWNDTNEMSCVYNGVPHSPCFLFARKFSSDAVAELMSLGPVLGYG